LARMKVDLPFVAALLRVTLLGRIVKRARRNAESAEVAENTEEAQGRAGSPRRAGGRRAGATGWWPFPTRSEPSREKRKWAVAAVGKLGKVVWRLGIMPEDSMFISVG